MAKIDEEDQDYYLQNNSPEYFEKEILNQSHYCIPII